MAPNYWTPDQIKFLTDNYETMTYAAIAREIGKTAPAVRNYAYVVMGLQREAGRPKREKKPKPEPRPKEKKRFPWHIRASLDKQEAMC